MKIRYRRIKNSDGSVVDKIERLPQGDWIDLRTKERISVLSGEYHEIPLGIAMELPKGFEAWVVPRSSTPKKWGLRKANSKAVIDFKFAGDTDEWHFLADCTKAVEIPANTRICQFRIALSQFATPWQKIKWLFTRKIEFVEVDCLGNVARGGIGSTGN